MRKGKLLIVLLAFLMVCVNVQAAQWDVDNPDIGTKYVNEGFQAALDNNDALDRVLSNYRQGCRLVYNSSTDIDIQAGEVTLSNSAGSVRLMMQTTSTTTDTPAVGASTTYYVYAVASLVTAETFTIEVSTNATTPSATYFKRLGLFKTDGSSQIADIQNDGFFSDLGTLESKSKDVTYRAMTDGFVMVSTNGGAGGSDTLVQILSDAATPPTTVMWRHQEDVEQVATGEDKSGFAAIKKGNNYWVDIDGMGGESIYWLPLE